MNNHIIKPKKGDIVRITLPKEAITKFRESGKMSPQELENLLKMYKPAEIIKYPNYTNLGVQDTETAINNFQAIQSHVKKAFDNGYFVEAASFILQYVDYDLRLYYAYHSNNKISTEHAFGDLIKLCENKYGFDTKLAARIRSFNETRVKMIHRFFLGECTLESMKHEVGQYKNLHMETKKYVEKNSGDVV